MRNPKQDGSNLFDCIPQIGPCPMNCNQCFYNRPGAFYCDINQPNIPSPDEVGNGIVRMNCGHDSNLEREKVIEVALKYKHFFFGTSIPNFNFPGPVEFTANRDEETVVSVPLVGDKSTSNIMFVRLRVSASNLQYIEEGVRVWTGFQIPVVLTFMAYYEALALQNVLDKIDTKLLIETNCNLENIYIWKKRHINQYWCPSRWFMEYVVKRMKKIGGRLVTMCGQLDSNYCKDCRQCELYYWLTLKHMKEVGE